MEQNLLSKAKFFSLKGIFMLIMFLWAGLASPLVKFYSPEYPFILIINVLILAYTYQHTKAKINVAPLLYLWGAYFVWYGCICLKYGELQPTDFTLVYAILIGYVAFQLYTIREFCVYYEKVLVFLAILSLIVWGSTVIATPMINVYRSLAIYRMQGLVNNSLLLVGAGEQDSGFGHIYRNLGFAWEAGRYSSFLVVGMFINLVNHRFDISLKNKNLYILFVALISTFSTTGFAALTAVIAFYFWNKSAMTKIVLIVLAVLTVPTIIALPFIGDKIASNWDYQQELSNMTYSFSEWGTASITPQRITGFYLDLLNFIHDPLLGYNVNEQAYMHQSLFKGFNVWLSDGILQIFSKYGIFVALFFYTLLFKVSSRITQTFNVKGSLFFAATFMLISVSYDFWGTGLFQTLVLYCYFSHFIKNKTWKQQYLS